MVDVAPVWTMRDTNVGDPVRGGRFPIHWCRSCVAHVCALEIYIHRLDGTADVLICLLTNRLLQESKSVAQALREVRGILPACGLLRLRPGSVRSDGHWGIVHVLGCVSVLPPVAY